MPLNIVVQILIGVALEVAGFMIQNAMTKPPTITDMDSPTASAGKPIPWVFGDRRVNDLNILHFGDKQTVMRSL
jgi:hypothetical protein